MSIQLAHSKQALLKFLRELSSKAPILQALQKFGGPFGTLSEGGIFTEPRMPQDKLMYFLLTITAD